MLVKRCQLLCSSLSLTLSVTLSLKSENVLKKSGKSPPINCRCFCGFSQRAVFTGRCLDGPRMTSGSVQQIGRCYHDRFFRLITLFYDYLVQYPHLADIPETGLQETSRMIGNK